MAEEIGFICPECPGRPQLGSEIKLREHWEALHLPDSGTLFEMEQKSGHDFQSSGWRATPVTCQVCNTLAWNLCCVCSKCQFTCHRKCLDALKDASKELFCPGFRQRTNTVFKTLRRLVSGVKKRYVMPFVDIDLTYITPRVIAMSYPATGFEAAYRNKMEDVAQLLHARHGEHYMIFNVSERCYDPTKFANQVLDFGWEDHLAPTLERLTSVCRSMDSWLRVDPRNAVVVHCKGGKGRTGVVIASFFVFAGLFVSAEDALREFAARRFGSRPGARVGVTQPSQRRFVHYFAQIITRSIEFTPRRLQVVGLYLRGEVPNYDGHGGCRPILQIFHALTNKVFESREMASYTFRDPYFSFPIDCILNIEGDVLIRCMHRNTSGKDSEMFRCQFHTFFVSTKAVTFHKRDLDSAHKDKRFPSSATFSLVFSERDITAAHPEAQLDSIRPGEHKLDERSRSASMGRLAPRPAHSASGTRIAVPAAAAGPTVYAASEGASADDLYDDDDEGDADGDGEGEEESEESARGSAVSAHGATAMSHEASLYFDSLRSSSSLTSGPIPTTAAGATTAAGTNTSSSSSLTQPHTPTTPAPAPAPAGPTLSHSTPEAAAILGLAGPAAAAAVTAASRVQSLEAPAALSTASSVPSRMSSGGSVGSGAWPASTSPFTPTAAGPVTTSQGPSFAIWPESPDEIAPDAIARAAAAASAPASSSRRRGSTPDISTTSNSSSRSRLHGSTDDVAGRLSQLALQGSETPKRWSTPSSLVAGDAAARLRSGSTRSVTSLPASVPSTLAEPPHPWYLGIISVGAAERVLRDKFEPGDFLVRREGAGWVLSVLVPGRAVEHYNIMWCEPGFALTQQPSDIFPSLADLITHHRTTPVTTTDTGLTVVLCRGVGDQGLPVGAPADADRPLRSVTAVDRRSRHTSD